MRLLAVAMFIALLLVGAVSLYAYTNYLFPLYGRLLRGAPVVETPYLAFGLLMAPPALAILLVGSAICAWTGKKFDPPPASRLHRFQALMFGISIKTLIHVVPCGDDSDYGGSAGQGLYALLEAADIGFCLAVVLGQ